MKTYAVTMRQRVWEQATVIVTGESEKEAEQNALHNPHIVWSYHEDDYDTPREVDNVQEVK